MIKDLMILTNASENYSSDPNIIEIEELRTFLEKEFPIETSNSTRDICENDDSKTISIEVKQNYDGFPKVLIHECETDENGEWIDNRELIDKIFAKLHSLGFAEDLDEPAFSWGGQRRNFGGEWWLEPRGITHYFSPILKYREDFVSKKDVDGLWVHVFNHSIPSSAEELKSFLEITGEISVSHWDPNISNPYFVMRGRGGPKGAFAILLKGKAPLCWDNDIWSIVDERTGLRTPTRHPSSAGSKHNECFLSPSKSEPVGIIVGPGANKEMAKNFIDSAEELGIPVHTMSLRTDPLSRDFDIPYEEWIDWEEKYASLIKGLVKIANNLDKRKLTREADYLDSLIQKWATPEAFNYFSINY